ncbi:MAG: GspH/FimT family pseudopilin [Phycisphaerae bacterium]|nr:GspH/FimT family pseudopilin [Phycisphaerae bacterium]
MRQDKEKMTVRTTRLQRRLRRSGCCCGQDCKAGDGFTLMEILLVVLIVAIAAAIAVPMMGSTASMQIRSAANMIAADLEYAKSMAISRQKNYSVVFNADPANSYYEVHDPDGIIEHPVKKGFDYKVDFSSDSRLNNVVIDAADFDPDSSNTITFDYLGSPHSGSETLNPLNSGVISISAGNFTMTINVEPVTGFISITD